MPSRARVTVAAALVAALGVLALTAEAAQPQAAGLVYKKLRNPARTVVSDTSGRWLATFTNGASTVTLAGPSRTFAERTASAPVTTGVWVRVLPTPFGGTVDATWLSRELLDTSPDVLAVTMQYVESAPPVYDRGLKIAGDADYGPLLPDGTRQEGSDFNDYLGVPWTYGGTIDAPEAAQLGSLDCSGFVRMVFGYRSGLPLGLDPAPQAIPRRSFQILASAPGLVTIPNRGTVADPAPLAAGDLVFFDASADDGTQIDHVGIFLGRDAAGGYRFISSRKSINGPTLGDYAGRSLLDGTGLYATSFRAARRL